MTNRVLHIVDKKESLEGAHLSLRVYVQLDGASVLSSEPHALVGGLVHFRVAGPEFEEEFSLRWITEHDFGSGVLVDEGFDVFYLVRLRMQTLHLDEPRIHQFAG